MVQLSPFPSLDEQQAFHAADRQTSNIGRTADIDGIRHRKAWDTAWRLRFLAERVAPGATVLDVGSGYGLMLAAFAERGYRVTGLEMNRDRCQISQRFSGAEVLEGDVYRLPDHLGSFEAVTMFHVVEHLVDPLPVLRALRARLRPGGVLVAEVPNRGDLLLETCAAYHTFYWQRAHVAYFTPVTLHALLAAAGFSEVEVHGVQRYGLENLMRWLVEGKPQLDNPSFETAGPYRWLERLYKARLEESKRCDTLVAVASG